MSLIKVLCRDYLCRCFLRRGTLEELLAKQQSVHIVSTEENVSNKEKIEMVDNNCMSIESDRISSTLSNDTSLYTASSPAGMSCDEDVFNSKVYFNDSKYMRKTEATVLKMTKKNIVDMIEREIDDHENYTLISNKYDIILSMKQTGSILSSKFPMIKMTYFINKADFHEKTTLKIIDQWMNNPSKRNKWDTGVKRYKKIEGDNEAYILHIIMNKPVFFISERDSIDKRVDFYHNDAFYCFSTSVNEDFIPFENNIIRITNLFSGYKMYEDDQGYHFFSITQMDLKMSVPQMVYNSTMPLKLKNWYDNLRKEINNTLSQMDKNKPTEESITEKSLPHELNEDDNVRLNNHEDIELK